MSDVRLPTSLPSQIPNGSGPPAAVRQAQAAFFRAALDQATAQPTPQQPQPQTSGAAQTEAPRPMRPGALLDIRV